MHFKWIFKITADLQRPGFSVSMVHHKCTRMIRLPRRMHESSADIMTDLLAAQDAY
jgi:hypothetical protein